MDRSASTRKELMAVKIATHVRAGASRGPTNPDGVGGDVVDRSFSDRKEVITVSISTHVRAGAHPWLDDD